MFAYYYQTIKRENIETTLRILLVFQYLIHHFIQLRPKLKQMQNHQQHNRFEWTLPILSYTLGKFLFIAKIILVLTLFATLPEVNAIAT